MSRCATCLHWMDECICPEPCLHDEVVGWVFCAEHEELVDAPCPHLGRWESDIQPCPSTHNDKVICHTCGGAGQVDRGQWGSCPGPHHVLYVGPEVSP